MTLLLLLACGPALNTAPQLYGLWTNTDDEGLVRVFEFEETLDEPALVGVTDAYQVYNYPEGTEPTVVQQGQYRVAESHVVTRPLPGEVEYSNEVLRFTGDLMVLVVDKETGGTRDYQRTDAPP